MVHDARSGSPWRVLPVLCGIGLLLSAGCEEAWSPPDAPEELNELSTFLFGNFDSDEGGVLEAGMGNLRTFLAGVDLTGDYEERCYHPSTLSQEEIDTVTNPGRDPAATLPVALAMSSAFPPERNAEVIVMDDQTMVEPASPDLYDREFVDPTDPSCFPDHGCDRLETHNTILKDYHLLELLYEMPKSFRWVEMDTPGSGEWAVMGRSWIEQEWWDEDVLIGLLQSYSLDVTYPVGDGAVRYLSLWPETYIDGLKDTDDFILSTTADGMNDMFVATETYISENL